MCIGCGAGKINISIDYNQQEIDAMIAKPPDFLQKKGSKIVKFILNYTTDRMADLIFMGGPIYTMNAANPLVEALAIKDGLILAVGTEEEIMTFRNGTKTQIVDLQGKSLLPGFVEPHIHIIFSLFKDWVDLGPFTNDTLEEARQKLTEAVEEASAKKEALMCQLFDPLITPGEFDVSLKALDEISETVPIVILEANGHIAHANTAAFKAAGITETAEDPPHGRYIRVDGVFTGEIQEPPAIRPFLKLAKRPTLDSFKNGVKELFQEANAKGITTVHDCGIGALDPRAEYSVLEGIDQMELPMRISAYLVSTHWDYWMEQKIIPNNQDSKLRVNGIKAWADGSTQGGSAFFRENYLRADWGRGMPNYSQEMLNEAVLRAHQRFWQVGIHCNGDAGIDMALQAFEMAENTVHREGLRHRLEHATFARDEHFHKMKKLDVYPSFLIGHVYYYGEEFIRLLGEERADLIDRVKTAIDHERRPSLHSDFNCQPIDPLRCIYNAVTRRTKRSQQVLNPKECVSPMEAIRTMTIDAAFQCHMDDIVGSLEVKKFADLVVLSQNPMTIEPEKILSIRVEQTWFEGKLIYQNQPQQ